MGLCMKKKRKTKKSSSSTSSARNNKRQNVSVAETSLNNQKNDSSNEPISENEKDLSHDLIQSYVKPHLKPLLIQMVTCTQNNHTVCLKNGKEIMLGKTYADLLHKSNLCTQVSSNEIESPTDCQTYADDVIESFEFDIVHCCTTKSQRWDKVVSFWTFSHSLQAILPPLSKKLEPEQQQQQPQVKQQHPVKQHQMIHEQQHQQHEIIPTIPVRAVPSPIKQMESQHNSQEYNQITTQQHTTTTHKELTKVEVSKGSLQQVQPKSSGQQQQMMAPPPVPSLSPVASPSPIPPQLPPLQLQHQQQQQQNNSPIARKAVPKTVKTTKLADSNPNLTITSRRQSDPTPRSPIRVLNHAWSNYENVEIEEKDANK